MVNPIAQWGEQELLESWKQQQDASMRYMLQIENELKAGEASQSALNNLRDIHTLLLNIFDEAKRRNEANATSIKRYFRHELFLQALAGTNTIGAGLALGVSGLQKIGAIEVNEYASTGAMIVASAASVIKNIFVRRVKVWDTNAQNISTILQNSVIITNVEYGLRFYSQKQLDVRLKNKIFRTFSNCLTNSQLHTPSLEEKALLKMATLDELLQKGSQDLATVQGIVKRTLDNLSEAPRGKRAVSICKLLHAQKKDLWHLFKRIEMELNGLGNSPDRHILRTLAHGTVETTAVGIDILAKMDGIVPGNIGKIVSFSVYTLGIIGGRVNDYYTNRELNQSQQWTQLRLIAHSLNSEIRFLRGMSMALMEGKQMQTLPKRYSSHRQLIAKAAMQAPMLELQKKAMHKRFLDWMDIAARNKKHTHLAARISWMDNDPTIEMMTPCPLSSDDDGLSLASCRAPAILASSDDLTIHSVNSPDSEDVALDTFIRSVWKRFHGDGQSSADGTPLSDRSLGPIPEFTGTLYLGGRGVGVT